MGERLSMLDTMFLELEQFDESAHMHIGAALIFDPLPGGGTPEIADLREHMRARMGILPRFAPAALGSTRGPGELARPGSRRRRSTSTRTSTTRPCPRREARPSCTSGSGTSGPTASTATGRSGR